MTGKVSVKFDTSEEATDDIAHAVAREFLGPECHASSSLRLEVRKIVLTVAEMIKRGPIEEKPIRPLNENPTEPHGTQTGEQG